MIPEGLHWKRDGDCDTLVDAQDYEWLIVYPPAIGDPDEWRENIINRISRVLDVNSQ